ncbi:MAG: hypothetical protein ACK452_10785 [Bacteroidota bacterium]
MKKIIFLSSAAVVLALTSCKKDRVCECTIVDAANGSTSKANVTFFDARKGDARLWCSSFSSQYEDLTPVAGADDKVTCELK